MIRYEDFLELLLNNARKLLSPEEWLKIDLSLSKTEIFCLLWMSRNDEVIMSQIADFLNIPMSTATGIVNRLVKNGYMERYRIETDRRVVVIRLTEKGKDLAEEIKRKTSHYFAIVISALDEEEKTFLLRIFQKIMHHLNNQQVHSQEEHPIKRIQNIPIE
ncbi:Transcriptional repressor MprA [Anoxybacillus sp. P3H1B]|uniref:MarR family winged helix-turn-helix transcriptional regulator n=1 Tax=Anoxybacillaceae TaxID=3120669 RepID=UPI000794ABBA|nr:MULTISPECIES: MarR family transcriptional regulator [Anoxybacillus]KXG11445.1 Transcriptional repressor MprA [Anoxybacillus sp. P3H1B]MBB3907227.1 DNA-binding MarR family transcriptional regulator [Anoxybacillus rupiensis]